MAAVQAKSERGVDLDPVDREVADLYDTLSTVAGVMNGEALRIVPHPDDPKATWYSLAELDRAPVPQVQRVRALALSLVDAYRAGDRPGVQTAASALGRRLAELAPGVYPREKDLAIEVHYNSLKPYRNAWALYLLGFLAAPLELPARLAQPRRSPASRWSWRRSSPPRTGWCCAS